MGKTSIGVRCNDKPGWSIFVQASVRVSVDMLVANRPLAQNTVLSANDFSLQNGELGQPGILIDPSQADRQDTQVRHRSGPGIASGYAARTFRRDAGTIDGGPGAQHRVFHPFGGTSSQ